MCIMHQAMLQPIKFLQNFIAYCHVRRLHIVHKCTGVLCGVRFFKFGESIVAFLFLDFLPCYYIHFQVVQKVRHLVMAIN